jgi:phenylpyruvate tautomerase PptA (4-oxalocrotonate tautomerase family)
MPLLQAKLIEEIFAPNQKTEIMTMLTDVSLVKGENVRSAAWFSIEEICNGEWCIGGKRTE